MSMETIRKIILAAIALSSTGYVASYAETTQPEFITESDQYDQISTARLRNPFYISDFTYTSHPSTSGNPKVLQCTVEHNVSAVEHTWVKYEDTSSYTAGQHLASDNPWSDDSEKSTRTWSIDNSKSTTHECRNFSDSYYRIYMEAENERPGYAVAANTLARISHPENTVRLSRVARTIAVSDNQTGIGEVTTDAVNAADAPVEYFNLQGVKVSNPSGGLFIRVQGRSRSKIYVK